MISCNDLTKERISFKLAVLTYRSIHGTSPTVVFHSCRRHDIRTTAACGLLPLIVYNYRPFVSLQQASGRSRRHVERPSVPCHICTVTRGRQRASQDFPLLSFLPGHPDMTYSSLLIVITVFFVFFRISRRLCNN